MGREPSQGESKEELRTEGSAQEVGMQKLWCRNALLSSLLAVALAVIPAEAQDAGGSITVRSIEWRTSYRRAADEANRDGKRLLISITASWCGPCRQMKQFTFSDSRVIDLVQSNFVALKIDADEHPELVTGFGVQAYPTTFIVDPDLTILKRMGGFQSAGSLLETLNSLPNSVQSVALMQSTQSSLAATKEVATSEIASALEPANTILFGFDGYCLVSLLEESRVCRGSAEFTAEHRGQAICFSTYENLQSFLADPEKYWPVANGQCLVSSRGGAFAGQGDPRMAVTWRGRIWLFSDRESQQRFIQAPLLYINEL
jgi:thioredoxin-related protein/YHS domain-containing protein